MTFPFRRDLSMLTDLPEARGDGSTARSCLFHRARDGALPVDCRLTRRGGLCGAGLLAGGTIFCRIRFRCAARYSGVKRHTAGRTIIRSDTVFMLNVRGGL